MSAYDHLSLLQSKTLGDLIARAPSPWSDQLVALAIEIAQALANATPGAPDVSFD